MHGSPHIVSDVMTHTVVAVGRDAAFKDIVRVMEQWKVSAVPVLEGEARVIGVVSEADLLPKEEFRDSDPDRYTQLRRLNDMAKAGGVTAEELMSSPAVTVHADATLAQAARIMAQRKVKRLPVVNQEGVLEGIVSRADLLKVFLRTDEELAEEVRREVVSYLFPAPLTPIRVEVEDRCRGDRVHQRPSGRSGGVWYGEDGDDFRRFLQDTTSGGVTRNDGLLHASLSNAPFGGVGGSGTGAGGKAGFDEFTHRRTVAAQTGPQGFTDGMVGSALLAPESTAGIDQACRGAGHRSR